MEVALVGVLGVVVGGVIGLAAQIITSRAEIKQKWAETRRVVYSDFIETISVSRRQLDDAAQARLAGRALPPGAAVDARALHLAAVAGWNRVRLISRSVALQDAARELTVRIQEFRDLLDAPGVPAPESIDAVNKSYDRHREAFMTEAQREIGLVRASAS